MQFNWLDYTLLGFVVCSILIGLVRGLVREFCALLNWIVAVWVSFCWYQPVSEFLPAALYSRSIRVLVGFASVFILTLLFGAVLSWLLCQLVAKTGLGGTDRMLGFVFGGLRGLLIVTLLLLLARLTPLPEEVWWRSSILIPYFKPLESWLYNSLPASVIEYIQVTEFENLSL